MSKLNLSKSSFIVKKSDTMKKYKSGMRRGSDYGKPNYALIDISFLNRLAMHLTRGAMIHGKGNWRLANSKEELDRFEESAFRHFIQRLRGDTDEDHMAAVCFNMMAAEYIKDKLEKEYIKDKLEKEND